MVTLLRASRSFARHTDMPDEMDKLFQSTEWQPQMDAFSNFVNLVVPKFAQRTGNRRWKYDIQRKEQQLTIFRLACHDDMVVVSDCLCLRFFANRADPSADLFIPIYSSRGKKAEPAFIQRVLGKGIVTSPEDVWTILNHLDSEYVNSDGEAVLKETPNTRRVKSLDVAEKWIAPFTENFGDESDDDLLLFDQIDEEYVDESCLPFSPSSLTEEIPADKHPAKVNKKKRPLEHGSTDSFWARSLSKKSRLTAVDEVDEDLLVKMHEKRFLELDVKDMPSSPPLPECGGTIFSSQYWNKPAVTRERLNCTMNIFVDKEAMISLESLAAGQLPFPVPLRVQELVRNVTYAWVLLEHFLGGTEAISRSFAYTSSGTCPIEKKELVKIVADLCDAVVEHMERSFSLKNKEDVRTEVLSLLHPIASVTYKDLKGGRERARIPSDIVLRDYLRKNSHPAEGKVQIAHGFDLYLNEKKMMIIEKRYFKEAVKKELTVVQLWGNFAMDILTELVGSMDVVSKRQEVTRSGIIALIGDDIFEALWARAQKTFGIENKPALKDFQKCFTSYSRPPKKRGTAVDVNNNTPLMASILFQPASDPVYDKEDPPAEPGCNYWTSPAPHRTRLSPSSDIYMLTSRLVEYQRYLGPERTTLKTVRASVDYATYLKALVPYAVGGEEAFIKSLLHRRTATRKGKNVPILDDSLMTAIFEHVERLFEVPNNERKSAVKRLYDCLNVFSIRLIELHNQGETRWHFPELDGRPKPEIVSVLEAQEYWRKPAPDRTQIRPGHDVYIRTKILEGIASHFGPGSKDNCIKKCSNALLVHMLGGPETAYQLWAKKTQRESAWKTYAGGLRSMFVFDDVVAVCLHSDEVFHLMFSITPSASLIYANARMQCARDHEKRRIKKGYQPKAVRGGDALHLALSIT